MLYIYAHRIKTVYNKQLQMHSILYIELLTTFVNIKHLYISYTCNQLSFRIHVIVEFVELLFCIIPEVDFWEYNVRV